MTGDIPATDPEDVDALHDDLGVTLEDSQTADEWFAEPRTYATAGNHTQAVVYAARIDDRLRDVLLGGSLYDEKWRDEYETVWRLAYYLRHEKRADETRPWCIGGEMDLSDKIRNRIRNLLKYIEAFGEEWAKDLDGEYDEYREKILWAVDDQKEMVHPDRPDGLVPEFPGFHDSSVSVTAAVMNGDEETIDVERRLDLEVYRPYTVPANYDAEKNETIKQPEAVQRTANIFCQAYSFLRPRSDVQGWFDSIYVYHPERHVYEPHGEEFIENRAEEYLGSAATNGFINQLVDKITRKSMATEWEIRDDEPDDGRIVVENGILDMRTGELESHTPEEYHKIRLPIEYDPDASPDAVDTRIREWVDEDNVDTVYRTIAHAVYPGYPAEKAVMLAGEGQNGKSILLRIIRELLDRRNVMSIDLQELTDGDFMAAHLAGNLANISGDMSGADVKDLSTFKTLTGNDETTANVKHEDPITFVNRATMIFAANEVPEMHEDDHAIWRRWVYINFPNQFTGEGAVPKHELLDEVTAEAELQGLLTRAVEEAVRYHQEGEDWFPEAGDPMEVREQLRNAAEPVYHFASECLVGDEGHVLPKDTVRSLYRAFAEEENLPQMGSSKFGKQLKTKPDINIESTQSRRPGEDSSIDQCYQNVALSERGLKLYYSEVADGDGADRDDLAPSSESFDDEIDDEEDEDDEENRLSATHHTTVKNLSDNTDLSTDEIVETVSADEGAVRELVDEVRSRQIESKEESNDGLGAELAREAGDD